MKRKNLVVLSLSAVLNLAAGAHATERDGLACCLADEWTVGDTVAELQQVAPAASEANARDLTCCLAGEWIVPDGPVVAGEGVSPQGHAADGFCCIADEWKL